MHHGGAPTARRDGIRSRKERGLTDVTFVGSYPQPDFALDPKLPEIGVVGRSNVGKSSLINALVGRRAIARISQTPGKTRLCNVFDVEHRYYLVDLPGYGYAQVSKNERRRFVQLVNGYIEKRSELIGVVWLVDIRRKPSAEDQMMGKLFDHSGLPVLAVITKADKIGRGKRSERVTDIVETLGLDGEQIMVTSAHTKEGIDDLRSSIEQFVRPEK
ncbi:MAG: ribosome biogenesis GTP-binding protein YihA/YsxC [Gemmatimonadales bacterium]